MRPAVIPTNLSGEARTARGEDGGGIQNSGVDLLQQLPRRFGMPSATCEGLEFPRTEHP